MLRGMVKAMVLVLGIVAAAPLSAQQPDSRPPRREWVAQRGHGQRQGPRRRKMRRHRRRRAAFNRMRMMRMRALRYRGFGGI
jgi:hypothetical protein